MKKGWDEEDGEDDMIEVEATRWTILMENGNVMDVKHQDSKLC